MNVTSLIINVNMDFNCHIHLRFRETCITTGWNVAIFLSGLDSICERRNIVIETIIIKSYK